MRSSNTPGVWCVRHAKIANKKRRAHTTLNSMLNQLAEDSAFKLELTADTRFGTDEDGPLFRELIASYGPICCYLGKDRFDRALAAGI